jgi:hypothetical protein
MVVMVVVRPRRRLQAKRALEELGWCRARQFGGQLGHLLPRGQAVAGMAAAAGVTAAAAGGQAAVGQVVCDNLHGEEGHLHGKTRWDLLKSQLGRELDHFRLRRWVHGHHGRRQHLRPNLEQREKVEHGARCYSPKRRKKSPA